MIFQGICLPYRPRFALFFIGIAFLGAISAPLQAADNPSPSAWDKLFGSAPQTPESAPKQQKPKNTKTSKESGKKQKSSGPQKASEESPVAATPTPPNKEASPPEKNEPSNLKAEIAPKAANPSTSTPFWKGMFSGASSSSPFLEGAATPSNTVQPVSAPINTPSADTPTSRAPSAPAAAGNKSGSDESTDTRVGINKTKSAVIPVEQSTSAPTTSTSTPPSISAAVAPSPSSTDTKANFALATVCEREKCELMILYDAPINKANVEKFVQSTASIPAGTSVLFNSIDGDLNSGIKLGQALRQKRFNTRVGRTKLNKKTLNEIDGQCYSACVLAFAGGVQRHVDTNDQIGIYALRSNSKTVNDNEMKAAVNSLGSYFEQMGVDRRLVNQMLEVKGTSVSLISPTNAKLLNLDNGNRVTTYPWRMQALDDGLLIILVTEKQSTNNFSITLGLTKQNKDKDFRLTIYAKPLSENTNLNQLAEYLNRDARLQLVFNNQTISPGLIKPWEATNSGVQTALLLSDKELMGMSSALEFELNLSQISSNPYRLDGVTIFGTSGLKGALAAIKK